MRRGGACSSARKSHESALLRIYQRDYRPEGPVRTHDPTAANGSHFQNAP